MCKISNEIKLCSCSSQNINELDNSWVVYRKQEGIYSFGETVRPENTVELNTTELEQLIFNLNSQQLFDFDFHPQEDDKLILKFTQDDKTLECKFIFEEGIWKSYNDPLAWMDEEIKPNTAGYSQINFGYIKHTSKK